MKEEQPLPDDWMKERCREIDYRFCSSPERGIKKQQKACRLCYNAFKLWRGMEDKEK